MTNAVLALALIALVLINVCYWLAKLVMMQRAMYEELSAGVIALYEAHEAEFRDTGVPFVSIEFVASEGPREHMARWN
jgi:hypothetical protein